MYVGILIARRHQGLQHRQNDMSHTLKIAVAPHETVRTAWPGRGERAYVCVGGQKPANSVERLQPG